MQVSSLQCSYKLRLVMEDYEKECSKRKARAEKFGTKYAPPKLEAFLPWSEAKRLKAKPKKGFTTGFDMLDSEEVRKQAARRARFSVSTATATGEPNDGKAPLTESATQSSTTVEKQENGTLPVVQAWDKQEIVSEYRVDPPMSLRTQPGSDSPDKTPYKLDPDNKQAPPTWIREKIHIFAIDWAAFKQMRNKDIMGFFSAYGPSYIEWLADLSCNIYFNDKFTAKRALMNLSQSIPSPPPPALGSIHTYPDLGNMTWRFCNRPIQKVLSAAIEAIFPLFLLTRPICDFSHLVACKR